jgi:hypothetical protein
MGLREIVDVIEAAEGADPRMVLLKMTLFMGCLAKRLMAAGMTEDEVSALIRDSQRDAEESIAATAEEMHRGRDAAR